MGRSVETRADALIEVYVDWSVSYEDWLANAEGWADEDDDLSEEAYYADWDTQTWEWESNRDWLVETIKEYWPSFWDNDRSSSAWYLRETTTLLRNQLVEVSISEYCGLTYIAVAPAEDVDSGLAIGFAKSIEEKFKTTFGQYRKVGTFNNGEAVYERI